MSQAVREAADEHFEAEAGGGDDGRHDKVLVY